MSEKYRPPVGPGSEQMHREKREYIPPVGPGSKSLPPTGSWRELPPGLLPQIEPIKSKK